MEKINIEDWIDGKIDRHQRDTTGTDYEKMLNDRKNIGISAWEDNDASYIPESPMDPYERYMTKQFNTTDDCATSIGGNDGKTFAPLGIWRKTCKMFFPTN